MEAYHQNGGTYHDDHVQVVNISEADHQWLASLEEKTKLIPKLLSKSAGKDTCCIFRVPQSLVEINEKAYQPLLVSIGPYHHGKHHLKMIQEQKYRFLGAVLARTQTHGIGLDDFFRTVASMEEKIRECYSERIDYGSHELIEMMIVDGCFMIELFCMVGRVVEPDNLDDPVFNLQWVFFFLMRDFLRLENQIPFFVLQSLFELSICSSGKADIPSLTQLALGYFDHALERPDEILHRYKNLTGKHLLDLFRLTFIPDEVSRKMMSTKLIQSVEKLGVAGIRFMPRERAESFLDIKFRNGVLKIPTISIDDFTTSFLLNSVAYEQCYNHCSKHMTSYVTFMGCLINSPVDAGILAGKKIVENNFGADEEVARFFGNVGKDVVFDIRRSYLGNVCEDVNEYYRNNWHARWAELKQTYFGSPWSFMSALAALVLLLLTMVQAFFAVYQYVHPPRQPN